MKFFIPVYQLYPKEWFLTLQILHPLYPNLGNKTGKIININGTIRFHYSF